MKKAAFLFTTLVMLLLLAVVGYSWYAGYDGCLQAFISIRGNAAVAQQLYNFVTPLKFVQFRYLLMVYVLILVIILLGFSTFYSFAGSMLAGIFRSLTSVFKAAFNGPFKYLLIIPVITPLFFVVTMPLNFDEALTWMWFTSKGLLSSAGYYPAPNNHILFSLITCVTKYIPFAGPVLCLRIPSAAAGFFALLLWYAMVNKHFNRNTALLVAGIGSMLFMSLYYSYMGRGYALVSLFFVAAFYAAMNIIKSETGVINFVCFGLASVLGFYTMPSFLYAFVMLNAIVVLGNRKAVRQLLVTNVLAGAFVTLLYMPVIIINGIGALVNNEYVAPLPRNEVLQRLPQFTVYAVHEITGIGAVYFAVALALALVLLIKKRNTKHLIIFFVLLAGPFVLVVAHSVIRYSRTFNYYAFVLVLLAAMPFSGYIQYIKTRYLLPVLVILQFALLLNFGSEIYLYEHYGQTADRVIAVIAGNKSYFCDEPLFEIPLQFNLRTGACNYAFNDTRNVPLSADTMTGYNYIVIRNECDHTQKRVPIIRSEYYAVY